MLPLLNEFMFETNWLLQSVGTFLTCITKVQNSTWNSSSKINFWSDLYIRSGKNDKLVGRLVFALSSLIRDNEKSLDTFFNKISGQEVFLRHLDHVASDVDGKKDSRLVVKILTFIADVLRSPESRQNVEISFDEKLCRHLMNDDLIQRDDLDHIEKFVYCLVSFEKLCRSEMSENGQLKLWLFKAKDIVRENQESESDFERTATHINELVTLLNLTKSEL